ncbi:DUF2283 domain-containing protein [bacterium]|nr:DUF2283 domain-containing protein [FCB group bacterium]MBL7192034.1 DUF2283 domain-containing protein [bacterium]
MRVHYSPDVDARYIRFNESNIETSDEITPNLIADYDRSGNIVGLEILCAAKITDLRKIILDKEMMTRAVEV